MRYQHLDNVQNTKPLQSFKKNHQELSSEGGPQSSRHDIEAELCDIRLNLLMEIERRKQSEESLNNMQRKWQMIGKQLSLVGLTLPAVSTIAAEDEHADVDPGEELCQQICIVRAVSNSVGRGSVRAEVEVEMESQIEAKNFEIARLWDRLHYYEAVNREMSQRNQEAIEIARHLRQRRKRMQRWVWSSIGTSIALGAAALAWSYLPTARESSPASFSQAPEGDDVAKP